MVNNWNAASWREKKIQQYPEYNDAEALTAVENQIKKSPELVSFGEIRNLKQDLAKVAEGKAFLLQGGDCAESFAEFSAENLRNYFRVVLQMTMVLMYGTGLPIVKVGRIAGQFAKPRSAPTENINGTDYLSYRGDMVNDLALDDAARQADPNRLLQVYNQSASTLNYLRSLARGGYAQIDKINEWNVEFVANSPQGARFKDIAENISDSLNFLEACQLHPAQIRELSEANFYTSHEGLHLAYEEALTRAGEDKNYCCSAHMLWIGNRTRNPEEAHVEFMRGIQNPIGIKISQEIPHDDLLKLLDTINPENEAGKIVLISRMGAGNVADGLPPILRKVESEGKKVIWSCDPMHGNTEKAANGYKTRKFNNILAEVQQFFEIHKAEGTVAGGVHFEMTGQDVTECLGGAQAISEVDLKERYQTACDPRLNGSQALELAFLISEALKAK